MTAIAIRAGEPEGEYVKKWLSGQLNPDHHDDH